MTYTKGNISIDCTKRQLHRLVAAKRALEYDNNGGAEDWTWDRFLDYADAYKCRTIAKRNRKVLIELMGF